MQKRLLCCRRSCICRVCRYGSCTRETFGSAGFHSGSPTCVQLPPFRLATIGGETLPVELTSEPIHEPYQPRRRPTPIRRYLRPATHQIGRAACREKVCEYVKFSVVAVPLK